MWHGSIAVCYTMIVLHESDGHMWVMQRVTVEVVDVTVIFSLVCVLCPALVSVTWEIVVHGEVCSQCDLCVFSLFVLGDTWCVARGTMH